jgi:dihydrofolate reductase
MSLDGFIARENGSIDWLDAVQVPDEDYGFRQFFDGVDALIVGRRAYETALGFDPWPYAGKRCVVMTHTAPESRHGEVFVSGDPVAAVDRLGAVGVKCIYVDGGVVISAFLQVGLIDDLTISIVPVLLGNGRQLFARNEIERSLTLVTSRAYESGLVQIRYATVRARSEG